MDRTAKAILILIAVALWLIAYKLYFPNVATLGKLADLRDKVTEVPNKNKKPLAEMTDAELEAELKEINALEEKRKEQYRKLLRQIPLVYVKGGNIDADVTGTVSIE